MSLAAIDAFVARFAPLAPEATAEARREQAAEVYWQLHCRLPADPLERERAAPRGDPREFLLRLAQADRGTGSWQAGWTVHAVRDDGGIVAESRGVRLWLGRGEYRTERDLLVPGAPVLARVPREHRVLAPGFYMATGDAIDRGDAPTARLYWTISATGVFALLERVTSTLNRARLPFRFKVPIDPRDYGRADAAVLYLPREHWTEAVPLLGAITASVRPHLGAETSLIARRLEAGVAVAEDPGDGSSFGQHRAQLLVAANSAPGASGLRTPDARARAIRIQLRAAGYDPLRLHLNPGTHEDFAWEAPTESAATA